MKELLEIYLNDMKDGKTDEENHVRWMLTEMKNFDDKGKFNRWLGFVQGYFWCNKIYTIDQMRDQVRNYL